MHANLTLHGKEFLASLSLTASASHRPRNLLLAFILRAGDLGGINRTVRDGYCGGIG